MKIVEFIYQEQLEVNCWGNERIVARYINDKKYYDTTRDSLPTWLKAFIKRNLKEELKFTKTHSVCIEHGNLSRPIATDTYYLSQKVKISGKTKHPDMKYYL